MVAKFSVLLKTEVNIRFTLVDDLSTPEEAIKRAMLDEFSFQRAIDSALSGLRLPGVEYVEGTGDYSAILVDEFPNTISLKAWLDGEHNAPTEHWFSGDGVTPIDPLSSRPS